MLSTSSWLLITSFFSLWQMPVSQRASSSSISPENETTCPHRLQYPCVPFTVCAYVTRTLWVCLIGVWTCKCKCKRRGHISWMGSCCQKQHRSHVCATNVILHYFDWMPPLRIILIKECLCKAIPSSLWEKKQLPAGTWQSSGRKCGRSCDEYFGPKMCPS